VHRTVDWIVESCSATPSEKDRYIYHFRVEALLPLCGRLDSDRAARVVDVLLAILGDREKIGPREIELKSLTLCVEVLTAAAERLDASGRARAAEELIRAMRKSESRVLPFEPFKLTLVTMCQRLDAAGAARVADAVVVAVRDPKTSTEVRSIFPSVLVAVGDQLDPVRADALERALVDSLLFDLAAAKGKFLVRTLAALTEVCGCAGAKSAARVADALTEKIRNPDTRIEFLPPLVTALGVAGRRLPPGDASSRAKLAIAELASLSRTRTKPLERIVLAEALTAARTGLGPTEASPHVRRMVADLEDLLRNPKPTPSTPFPVEQRHIARVLVVAYGALGPAERAAHSTAPLASHANTILAELRNPKNNLGLMTRGDFADSVVLLCTLLDQSESVPMLDALLPTLSYLDMQGYQLDVRERPIKKAFSRLEEADLRRLLEHPFAVGGLQRIILDALGEQKHCSFRNTWAYLDWTESH
jgi:hypothetical protein